MLLNFCAQNRGNRCFNITTPLALEFGLLRMVKQPIADTHVIWVAQHKVTQPQTILKFRPPSSLDYRTCHGSQSCWYVNCFSKAFLTQTQKNLCSDYVRKSSPILQTIRAHSRQCALICSTSYLWLYGERLAHLQLLYRASARWTVL
jgi:hypothetical protein